MHSSDRTDALKLSIVANLLAGKPALHNLVADVSAPSEAAMAALAALTQEGTLLHGEDGVRRYRLASPPTDARDAYRHPLAVAKIDYEPLLASIDFRAIERAPRPADLQAKLDIGIPADWTPAAAVRFCILWASLNFCFWRLHAGKLERYQENGVVGANLMTAKLLAAWSDTPSHDAATSPLAEDERPATNAMNVARAFLEGGVKGLFGDIPLPLHRYAIVREQLMMLGAPPLEVLVDAFVAATHPAKAKVTLDDARLLTETLPISYADPYLKKAQLALCAFAGWASKNGTPVSVDELSAFADYQVPRILRHLGFIHYSEELAGYVDGLHLLEPGSKEENAIRAATLLACDAMARAWECSPAAVDGWLWYARNKAEKPFHLTYGSDY